jgi:hypothetical protein
MKNRRNYYRILQIQPDASAEVIRASYRAQMLKMKSHPDLGGSPEQASLLNEAYEVLSDPARRAAYDRQMGLEPAKARRPLSGNHCPVCSLPLEDKPAHGARCPNCESPLQSEKPRDQQDTYRRAVARSNKDMDIIYYPAWPGAACRGRMVDFSPKGMRFLCGERLRRGMVLKISCEILEAAAQVTNVREEVIEGDTIGVVGVAFLAVSFLESRGSLFSTSV